MNMESTDPAQTAIPLLALKYDEESPRITLNLVILLLGVACIAAGGFLITL